MNLTFDRELRDVKQRIAPSCNFISGVVAKGVHRKTTIKHGLLICTLQFSNSGGELTAIRSLRNWGAIHAKFDMFDSSVILDETTYPEIFKFLETIPWNEIVKGFRPFIELNNYPVSEDILKIYEG